MLQENVLVHGDQVSLIDFDDCAYSYPLFDLTTPLVQRLPDPNFAEIRGVAGRVWRRRSAYPGAALCHPMLHLSGLGAGQADNASGGSHVRADKNTRYSAS